MDQLFRFAAEGMRNIMQLFIVMAVMLRHVLQESYRFLPGMHSELMIMMMVIVHTDLLFRCMFLLSEMQLFHAFHLIADRFELTGCAVR